MVGTVTGTPRSARRLGPCSSVGQVALRASFHATSQPGYISTSSDTGPRSRVLRNGWAPGRHTAVLTRRSPTQPPQCPRDGYGHGDVVEASDESSRRTRFPAWVRTVEPGTLDRRVLDQDQLWITFESQALTLAEMPSDHLRNVRAMLETHAPRLHFEAVLDAVETAALGDLSGCPSGDRLVFELLGRTVADCEPLTWLHTTALIRAIGRALRRRGDE